MKYAVDNFHVHFFSSGDKRRNEIVVEKSWQSVFHCAKPDHVRILSREDTTFRNFENPQKILDLSARPIYGLEHGTINEYMYFWGNTKKDITKLGPMNKTILVDDDSSFVMKNQVKNFLQASCYSFDTIFENCENKEGEKYKNMASKLKSLLAAENRCLRWYDMGCYLAFHKLLHITGVLERAKLHQGGIVEGLANIYFINGEANHQAVGGSISFSKKGLDVLSNHEMVGPSRSKYATNASYPKLECLENLIF